MLYSKVKRMDLRNTIKFKITNKIWNDLKLNIGWCIGHLTYLCKLSGATTFAEWEIYYLESGKKRLEDIDSLLLFKKQVLLDHTLYQEQRMDKLKLLYRDEVEINTQRGRTIEDLNIIAKELYKGVIKQSIKGISLEDCENFTYVRVLDETWLGAEREINTQKTLRRLMPTCEVRDVSITVDRKFAVDFEVYNNDILSFAVQVKSNKYYTDESDILLETKGYNREKNKQYQNQFGVPVIYVYSDVVGRISNEEELKKYILDNITSKEIISSIDENQTIYFEICDTLNNYEKGNYKAEDLYSMLVKVQSNWGTIAISTGI